MERPSTRARKRDGRCYQVAFRALMEMEQGTQWRLFHGRITTPLDINNLSLFPSHAWLSDGAEVWCPTFNRFYRKADWERLYRPVTVATYSQQEAAEKASQARHFGPWDIADPTLDPIEQ